MNKISENIEVAVFANGCFWCTEAVFSMLNGVKSVLPGYTGGTTENPNYHAIRDHAEAIQIEYDPSVITYDDLLSVFFNTHDPTTLNRQGNDIGTQYRSGIYYANDEQKEKAETLVHELNESKAYEKPVVTEIKPLTKFYVAEEYHREYYKNNSAQPYCQLVIAPKLEKLQERFEKLLKK
jgi:peptide-methionine (S)-S-oxide reductase